MDKIIAGLLLCKKLNSNHTSYSVIDNRRLSVLYNGLILFLIRISSEQTSSCHKHERVTATDRYTAVIITKSRLFLCKLHTFYSAILLSLILHLQNCMKSNVSSRLRIFCVIYSSLLPTGSHEQCHHVFDESATFWRAQAGAAANSLVHQHVHTGLANTTSCMSTRSQ